MKTCRVCLKLLEVVYPVGACERSFINNIMKFNGFPEITDKHNACSECIHLVRKFHNFKERILRAQEIYKDSNYMISIDTLKNIDRSQLDLNLSMCKPLFLSISDTNIVNNKKIVNAQVNRAVIIYDHEHLDDEIPKNMQIKLENPTSCDNQNYDEFNYELSYDQDYQESKSIEVTIKDEFHAIDIDANSDYNNDMSIESMVGTEPLIVLANTEDTQETDPLSNSELSFEANKKTSNIVNANDSKARKRRPVTARGRSIRSMIKEDITEKNIITTKRTVHIKSYREYFDKSKISDEPFDKTRKPDIDTGTDSEFSQKNDNEWSDFSPNNDNESPCTSSSEEEFNEEGKLIKKRITYPRECTLCDYEAPNATENWHHFLRCHPDEEYPYGKDKLLCQICGKYVSLTSMKANHTHDTEEHTCLHCGKKYGSRAKLLKHQWTRHNQKRLNCDMCGKHFATRIELLIHVRSHMGIKPHKCPHCDHRVAHRGNLIPHLKGVHQIVLDDKPFPERKTKIKPKRKIRRRKRSETDSDSAPETNKKVKPKRKRSETDLDSVPETIKNVKPKRKRSKTDLDSDPETNNKIKQKSKRSEADLDSVPETNKKIKPKRKRIETYLDSVSNTNKIKPKTKIRRRKRSETDSDSDVPLSVTKKLVNTLSNT